MAAPRHRLVTACSDQAREPQATFCKSSTRCMEGAARTGSSARTRTWVPGVSSGRALRPEALAAGQRHGRRGDAASGPPARRARALAAAAGAAGRRLRRFFGRGRPAAAAAPGLIADGAVRHLAEPELRQGPDLTALQAHQGDEDLVPVGVEHRARPALLRAGALRAARACAPAARGRASPCRAWYPWINQEPLTPAGPGGQWISGVGAAAGAAQQGRQEQQQDRGRQRRWRSSSSWSTGMPGPSGPPTVDRAATGRPRARAEHAPSAQAAVGHRAAWVEGRVDDQSAVHLVREHVPAQRARGRSGSGRRRR